MYQESKTLMRNLGISRVHNSSTTILQNGEIVYHLENERLSNRKYDAFPFQCLTDLDTKNLDKFGDKIKKHTYSMYKLIKNLKLDLVNGDHLAIIGPSGCGKTTFAKTIVNMLPQGSITEGYIKIIGEDITKIGKKEIQLFRRNNFGFIYQDSIKKLNPLMRVGDHLYELLKTHFQNNPSVNIKNLVEKNFRRVGIDSERLDSFPHEFSGGMRQRVSIAMALALKPKILIADEPTTSLDTKTSFEVMNEILYLCEKSGTTLVLISHDINLAAKWCKKVVIMNQGSIQEKGNIKEVFKSPKSKIGTKLINAVNTCLLYTSPSPRDS